MKKEERLQQQCDVCGRLLDKNISNFRKYSRKTNGNYYIDPNRQLKGTDIQEMRTKGAKIPSGFNTLNDDEIAKLHNTFASNTINKRSNTMLIAKRGVQIKRRIIK